MKKTKRRIGIIGAGPGGTAAAMLLASRGFDVEVFEKEAIVGGRSSEVKLGDYRFDLGPTFLMMKFLMDELFYSAGRKTEDYLDCRKLETMYDLKFGKREMRISADREKMRSEIERVFPGEGEGLDRFYEKEAVRFEMMYPCLRKDYGKLSSFLSVGLMNAFPYVAAGRSLYDVLSDYFKSEELRLAFTFQSKYLGMSPWECPGGFAMIPYSQHAHGIYHVMGGLSQIPRAFQKVAEEHGAKFHFSSPVKTLEFKAPDKKKVTGFVLRDGRHLEFDDVIVNADFGHAVTNLFPADKLGKWTPKAIEKKKFSCSTFMLYLGLDRTYETGFHTILFANEYKRNIEEISQSLVLSQDASIYVRNAAVLDESVAPSGHSALYVLAPVPNNFSQIHWDKEKGAFRDLILATLEKRAGYENIRSHIKEELVVTPWDWEKNRSVFKGATFNLSHNISQMLYKRPHNEFEDFKNCYLVGGGTHPGSGLPTIFESARITTNLLCDKYDIEQLKSIELSEALHA